MDEQVIENLKRLYSETAQEPVPERFTRLLQQLRDQETSENGAKAEGEGEQ
ncbi:NepR family anti-sigma factor [Sedimentitalea nanhaiensis]|nr:NepR family anti-sigma factor [Sedimentitalea nanhaiensis]